MYYHKDVYGHYLVKSKGAYMYHNRKYKNLHSLLFSLLLLLLLVPSTFACGTSNPHDDLDLDSKLDISVEQVMESFSSIYETLLDQLTNDDTIPFLNLTYKEMSNVKRTFQEALERYYENPACCLDELEDKLAASFELTGYMRDRIGVDMHNIYTKDGTWRKGLVLVLNSFNTSEENTYPLRIPISKDDTLGIDSVPITCFSQVSMNVGFDFDGESVTAYINRDQFYVKGSLFFKFEPVSVGKLGNQNVTIKVDSVTAPSIGFSAGKEMDYDYFNESAWYPAIKPLEAKGYFEGVWCSGEMKVNNRDVVSLIRLGMVSPKGDVVYSRRKQKFYSETKKLNAKFLPSKKLSPFDWVVEITP